MLNKPNILKVALLGLGFAMSFRTVLAADATKLATKPDSTISSTTRVAAEKVQEQRAISSQEKPTKVSFASPRRNGGIFRFSRADDALGRHISRFSGPPGPTLTVPGANFLRGPLTPAQMGQLFSESVEIGEGEVLYDFPPGTSIRKIAAIQTAQKN